MGIIKKRIHFIGIGGISISALAMLARDKNYIVTGSDNNSIPRIDELKEYGIDCYLGCNIEKIIDADFVVYSSAVPFSNIEIAFCEANSIPIIARSEFLGMVAKEYRNVIAVSGTHGKTTTTCMLAHILRAAEASVTAHIGGISENYNTNYFNKGNEIFLTEACEYRKSFLSLDPQIGIITNVDYDHVDTYNSLEEVRDTFIEFANKCDFVIIPSNLDCIDIKIEKCTFGNIDSTYYAQIIEVDEYYSNFNLCSYEHTLIYDIGVRAGGRYNIDNAICACVAAIKLGISPDCIRKAMGTFIGVKRRYERIGKVHGVTVIHDYAHHPSEIEKVIDVAKLGGRVCVVFEPHTSNRTDVLFDQFCECFQSATMLVLLPTYCARNNCNGLVDSVALAKGVVNKDVHYADSYKLAYDYVLNNINDIDTILVLGAGNVYKFAQMLVL